MRSLTRILFELGLRAFPRDFREAFAEEMSMVFDQRCSERQGFSLIFFAVAESVDAAIAGYRMRLTSVVHKPALTASIAMAILVTTLAIHDSQSPGTHRIDFAGHDPAGAFTLTIVDGKPVAATLDRVALEPDRIRQSGDSIAIIADNGGVALAVAFDQANSRIQWEPRR
jgi:hypothetical protein